MVDIYTIDHSLRSLSQDQSIKKMNSKEQNLQYSVWGDESVSVDSQKANRSTQNQWFNDDESDIDEDKR